MKSMKKDQKWILQLDGKVRQLRKGISQVEQINTEISNQKHNKENSERNIEKSKAKTTGKQQSSQTI